MEQYTLCALLALSLCSFLDVNDAQRTPNKAVTAYCVYDSDESSLLMVFLADYNGDPVDKVLPLTGRTYDRVNNNEAACTYTSIGGANDKIQITSKMYTDNSKPDENPCGGRRTNNPNVQDEYEWTVELREHWTFKIYTEIDRRYLIQCRVQDATSNMITTSIQVYGEDVEDNSVRYRPNNEMSLLEFESGEWRKWTGGVNGLPIGERVKLRVTSNLHQNYDPLLYFYGNAPFSCTRSESSTFNPNVGETLDFIGTDSCPTAVDPFGLSNGFTKAGVQVQAGGFYNMETEAFVFAPGIPNALQYHLRCYLKYCHGVYDANNPANNDQTCEDPCTASQQLRKRRSMSLNDHDQVILTVKIDSSRVNGKNEEQDSTPDDSTQTTLIVVIAVIGALIFAMAIVVTCFMLVARQRRQKADDISSVASSQDLPVYQVEKA